MHHDFIRHLSFNSHAPFGTVRPSAEPLRCVMRSFNEDVPPFAAYRPSPRPAGRGDQKSKIKNRK